MRDPCWIGFLAVISFTIPLQLFAGGDIVFERDTITVPAPADAQEVKAVYRFTNTGTTTVTILETQAECGCTAAQLEKRHYGPSESGRITVTFDTGGRLGHQVKSVNVITDEDEHPVHKLLLITDLKSYVQIEPRLLDWKENEIRKAKTITITAGADQFISIEKIESRHGFFKAGLRNRIPGKQFEVVVVPLDMKQSFSDMLVFSIKISGVGERTYNAFVRVD